MSDAVDVQDEVWTEEDDARANDAVWTSILPAPTLPASMLADQGGDFTPSAPPIGDSRAESPVNLKPYLLIRIGRRLCGLR